MIELLNVRKVFNVGSPSEYSAINGINLHIGENKVTVLKGPSGCGKTTLLSIIACMSRPTAGRVKLNDREITSLPERFLTDIRRKTFGFIFQQPNLISGISVLENVMLPLELAGRRDARPTATDMLGRVGLGSRLNHYPKVLSGGEQQRVALARAFVVRPAVLLADEPTGSLDHATGETIMQLMFDLNAELGTTLVLVTHDRAIAARCERRITIEAGQMV